MTQTPTTSRHRRLFRVLAIAFALSVVALTLACGDDDGDSPTNTGDASPTGSQGPTPSRTQGGTPVTTPAGTTGLPALCTEPDSQRGLLSSVEFSGEDGLFDQGEDIEMTQTMTNCGDNTVVLHYPTTQRYLLTIEEADTAVVVWDSADNKSFQDTAEAVEIPVGGTQIFTDTWDQTNSDGDQVEKGDYKVAFYNVGCTLEGQSDCQFGSVKALKIQ